MNKILMENDRVKVQNTTFEPGEKIPLHHHSDSVVYTLKGGKLALTANGKTDTVNFEKDTVTYQTETTHEAENTGPTTVDLLVVELKK